MLKKNLINGTQQKKSLHQIKRSLKGKKTRKDDIKKKYDEMIDEGFNDLNQ